MTNMRAKIIEAGIKNLKAFGYPNVNPENILTDYIYSRFFMRMLEGTIEDGPGSLAAAECQKLIGEIKAQQDARAGQTRKE